MRYKIIIQDNIHYIPSWFTASDLGDGIFYTFSHFSDVNYALPTPNENMATMGKIFDIFIPYGEMCQGNYDKLFAKTKDPVSLIAKQLDACWRLLYDYIHEYNAISKDGKIIKHLCYHMDNNEFVLDKMCHIEKWLLELDKVQSPELDENEDLQF